MINIGLLKHSKTVFYSNAISYATITSDGIN